MTEQKSEHAQALDVAMETFWGFNPPVANIRNPHARAAKIERLKIEAAVKAYNEHRGKVTS